MGGSGSGWQRTRKLRIDEGLTLAVKDLVAIGALDRCWRKGSLSWRSGGETLATLEYETSTYPEGNGTLWLRYVVDDQQTLVSTVPHYGGRRWWFICPIKKIRVAKLFLPPGATRFASRKAHDLTYRSVQESGWRKRFRRRMAQQLASSP
jgi:hypothetical protein